MSQPLTIAHHDTLALLLQIAVLLLTARLLAEIAQRWGQPSVLGEILAGIILGPSLLGWFAPAIGAWVIPSTPAQIHFLEVVSLFGVMFLLLITGLETDLPLIRRHARSALATATGGLVLPFICGFLVSLTLPDDLLVDPNQRLVFSLFLATAISLSAIPVVAKVLMDLNLIRRDIGQITIAAAMVDDTVAWVFLSIVAGLASGQAVTPGSVFLTIGRVLGFIIISFFAGRWLVKSALSFTQNELVSRDKVLSLAIIFTFAWGAFSQILGLEAVLGAFVVGILFAQLPSLPREMLEKLESLAFGIFAPIFFAAAGLKVNISNLLEPRLLGLALLMIGVAVASKVAGAYLGARWAGSNHWTALSFGAGLNARGAIQIIVATIGLSLGILSQTVFSMIILMAVVTSLMTPFALRWTLRHVEPEQQELERLRHEALLKNNFITAIHRVLLPVRYRPVNHGSSIQTIEAWILERLGSKTELSRVMLLTVASDGDKSESVHFLNHLGSTFSPTNLTKKVVESQKPAEVILSEAAKDYDLLILGASERQRQSGRLFSPLVDELVRLSPCPSLVVRGHLSPETWTPRRILVPTNGSVASKRACDMAFALVDGEDEQVHLLKVIEQSQGNYSFALDEELRERQFMIAHQIIDELRAMGKTLGVQTLAHIEVGSDPETVILNIARQARIDLIILGTGIRPGSDRLYLGPRVERILRHAPCPVIVVNSIG